MAGNAVEYIYTDSRHSNPLCRVTPSEFMEAEDFDYDKEKYREMLFEATETVLGSFGFDRSVYGNAKKKIRKWWHELSEERIRDRDRETERV